MLAITVQGAVMAQNTPNGDQKKPVHLVVKQIENGRSITIDTIVYDDSQEAIDKIMADKGIKLRTPPAPPRPPVAPAPPSPPAMKGVPAPPAPPAPPSPPSPPSSCRHAKSVTIIRSGDDADGESKITIHDLNDEEDADDDDHAYSFSFDGDSMEVFMKNIRINIDSIMEVAMQNVNDATKNIRYSYSYTTDDKTDREIKKDAKKAARNHKKAASASTLNVMPNPNNGQFKINYKSGSDKPATITIRDSEGKLISKEEIKDADELKDKSVDLTGKPAGIYTIEINQGGNLTITKIAIQ